VRLLARLRWRAAPTQSFFICGTPRSGTTLLAGLLAGTKLVGWAGEHFSKSNEPRWAAKNYRKYIRRCFAETSNNRVFGAKLLPRDFERVLARLRALPGLAELSDRAVLEAAFPQPRFLLTSRRDVVAQAVSWVKADQTGEFYTGDGRATGAAPRFDYQEIREIVKELTEDNEKWRRWFAENGIEPFTVVYEDLVADEAGTTRAALRFLGFEPPADLKLARVTTKQADAVNAEWIARYHEMATDRSGR
jgi:LPS sulfotransferase NodH